MHLELFKVAVANGDRMVVAGANGAMMHPIRYGAKQSAVPTTDIWLIKVLDPT